MAFVITDECVFCGTCKEECPGQAIFSSSGKYKIEASSCLECATCLETCPTGAIVED